MHAHDIRLFAHARAMRTKKSDVTYVTINVTHAQGFTMPTALASIRRLEKYRLQSDTDSWKQFFSCDWLVYWIVKSDGNFSKCFWNVRFK